MNNKEIAQLLKDALGGQDSEAVWFAIGELEKEPSDDYKVGHEKGEQEGGVNVLESLREVYGEGIEETDAWGDYMNKEGK